MYVRKYNRLMQLVLDGWEIFSKVKGKCIEFFTSGISVIGSKLSPPMSTAVFSS